MAGDTGLRRGFPRSGEGFEEVGGPDYHSDRDYNAAAGVPRHAAPDEYRSNVPPPVRRAAPALPSVFRSVTAAGVGRK